MGKERARYTVLRFQSTLPARGATSAKLRIRKNDFYFNPRSPHGERLATFKAGKTRKAISIHAPRTGSDAEKAAAQEAQEISIHAPRTGSDAWGYDQTNVDFYHFNPRSPHGERRSRAASDRRFPHFNPRSPHGERLDTDEIRYSFWLISIHAPRTGSDFPDLLTCPIC